MANEIFKEIKTRVALRTGDYAYWTTGAGKDIELLKGEVCVCTVAATDNQATTAPTVLFKVCDTTGKKFADLDWVSGLAADVHSWAKAANAPDEIDTRYAFEIKEGKLQVTETKYINEVAQTPVVTSYDFVTPEELTEILKGYYTKDEVDALIEGVNDKIDGLDESVTTVTKGTGITVTDNAAEGSNDHAYTVELDVAGAKTALGLGDAAYATVESLNTTAKGYADAVETGVENGTIVAAKATNADNAAEATHATNADNATNAQHAGSATKVDNALTVKVGGAEVVFDGSAPKTADVDAAIKNAIDAIPEQTDYSVSIEEDTTDTTIAKRYIFKQLDKEIGRIDLAKELVVTSGSVKEVTTADVPYTGAKVGDKYIELVIANQTTPIYVPAKDLVDIYTYEKNATEVQVNIDNQNVVSATLVNGGVSTEKIADKSVTAGKLADTVNTDIAKGVTAHGWGNHADAGYLKSGDIANKADKVIGATNGNFAGLDANGNLTDSGKKADDFATADHDHEGKVIRPTEIQFSDALAGSASIDKDGIHINWNAGGDVIEITREQVNIYNQGSTTLNISREDGISDYKLTMGETTVTETELAQLNTPLATAEALNTVSEVANDAKTHATTNAGLIQGNTNRIKALEDANHISEVTTTKDGGLKVTNKNQIDIDTDVVFVLNCNW